MPSGKHMDERTRLFIVDMNAQCNADSHPRFTFREIAKAAAVGERTVALVIRDYAAAARRRERAAERLSDLADPRDT